MNDVTEHIKNNTELKKLVKEYLKKGWKITITKGNHLCWTPPFPTNSVVHTGTKPSSYRHILNIKKDLERCSSHRFQHVAKK